MRFKQACVYGVTESRRIRGTELYRLLEQIGFPSLLSLMRFITFSPPRTRSKPPSLEALYSFPPLTL